MTDTDTAAQPAAAAAAGVADKGEQDFGRRANESRADFIKREYSALRPFVIISSSCEPGPAQLQQPQAASRRRSSSKGSRGHAPTAASVDVAMGVLVLVGCSASSFGWTAAVRSNMSCSNVLCPASKQTSEPVQGTSFHLPVNSGLPSTLL